MEFILEQMRLCLAVKDYIRTQIISKKINTKFFQEENTEVSMSLHSLFTLSVWLGAASLTYVELVSEIKVEVL